MLLVTVYTAHWNTPFKISLIL